MLLIGVEKVSDRDILDVAKVLPAHRHTFFYELDMTDSDIQNAEMSADSRDAVLQIRKVLTLWRQQNGSNATRRKVVDALIECGFNEAKEILAKKWDIITQGN